MNDGLAVMAEQCATCIFRPGNPMHLNPGRVTSMVQDCRRNDSHVICHETINPTADEEWGNDSGARPMADGEAVCRGFIDAGHTSQLLRIAERLNMIREVRP